MPTNMSVTCVESNHFVTIDVIIVHGTIGQTTCKCIFDYKMVLNHICNMQLVM
jgi:hypothetical protein